MAQPKLLVGLFNQLCTSAINCVLENEITFPDCPPGASAVAEAVELKEPPGVVQVGLVEGVVAL
jgi:hypothetical protein